jgi:hypothetical protein
MVEATQAATQPHLPELAQSRWLQRNGVQSRASTGCQFRQSPITIIFARIITARETLAIGERKLELNRRSNWGKTGDAIWNRQF